MMFDVLWVGIDSSVVNMWFVKIKITKYTSVSETSFLSNPLSSYPFYLFTCRGKTKLLKIVNSLTAFSYYDVSPKAIMCF